MKWYMIAWTLFPFCAPAQEQPSSVLEQQLENITEVAEDGETTNDEWWQNLEYLKQKPLNLNEATASDISELQLLTDLQANNFISYRNLLGKLISIYELQAVPGWDINLVKKLLPYVTIADPVFTKEEIRQRLNKGNHYLLLRYSRVLEKADGYVRKDSSRSSYAGDPSRLMFRYKYQYKNLFQYGITISKDAGEPVYNKSFNGFDFYSFHCFAGNIGVVKALALGDYTINMGQGLIYWQGLSFGKGAAVLNIKRQSPVLRPYNSPGSFYFNRGAAITLEKNRWQSTAFFSYRKLDAHTTIDPLNDEDIAVSVHTSGYHRTQSERSDRANLQQFTYGGNIRYKASRWYAGLNMVESHFNKDIRKNPEPYNLFALSGKRHANYSIDYGLTFRNIHVFGEVAIDRHFNRAAINGMLLSVHPKANIALLHRSISKFYQSFYGNAFTAGSTVTNEQGLFAGFSMQPFNKFRFDMYADIFHFPWLKYRIDAPSYGKDYFVQFTYSPDKRTELYSRYRIRHKPVNEKSESNALNEVTCFSNRSWRTQINHRLSRAFSIRQRFEILWYSTERGSSEKGFLAFFDLLYQPPQTRISLNTRLQYFESDSYNSRLYAYENDVLYYYSVPVFYDKGSRYYVNVKYNLGTFVDIWLKWGQTLYSDKSSIGSGLDEIMGNKKSEIRILLSATF